MSHLVIHKIDIGKVKTSKNVMKLLKLLLTVIVKYPVYSFFRTGKKRITMGRNSSVNEVNGFSSVVESQIFGEEDGNIWNYDPMTGETNSLWTDYWVALPVPKVCGPSVYRHCTFPEGRELTQLCHSAAGRPRPAPQSPKGRSGEWSKQTVLRQT